MSVSAQEVKELRERTGAGLMDCKRALVEAGGDQEKAILLLRQKGQAKAATKRSRSAREGIVAHYVHADTKKAALVELNCETDFVARNGEFRNLGRELCMQVVARSPLAVSREQLPAELVETQKRILAHAAAAEGKPPEVAEKIVEGRLEKFYGEVCLLEQPYIRDESMTVRGLIDEAIGKLGENIEVRRFVRMEVGEEPHQQAEAFGAAGVDPE